MLEVINFLRLQAPSLGLFAELFGGNEFEWVELGRDALVHVLDCYTGRLSRNERMHARCPMSQQIILEGPMNFTKHVSTVSCTDIPNP